MRIGHTAILLALAVLILPTQSCKDDQARELFELTHVMDFDIPAGLNTFDTHFFLIPQVNTIVDDQLAATGLSEEDIGSIKPKFCRFSTIFEDRDLDFIRLIEIRVIDRFDTDIQREVFYLDPVLANTREVIRPFPGLADVNDIISSPSFAVEIRLRFRYPPPETFEMRLSMDFGVFAD